MFKKLISIITLLVMLSPMVFARRNGAEQVSELDYSRKLWLEVPSVNSNAYFQWDKTNTEIDTPANVNFSSEITISSNVTINGDIILENDEEIVNSTNGTIGFTDGTNTLATIVDGGTTGTRACE